MDKDGIISAIAKEIAERTGISEEDATKVITALLDNKDILISLFKNIIDIKI